MVIAAVFVAFAHGANDVGNAVGPFSVVYQYSILLNVTVSTIDDHLPIYMYVLGGIAIVIGLGVLGQRVMKTVGKDITNLDFVKGYSAQYGTAVTVLLATLLLLPVSTTAILLGSVTGSGLKYSFKEKKLVGVEFKVLLKIFIGWITTLLVGFLLTSGIYLALTKWIYLDRLNNGTNALFY